MAYTGTIYRGVDYSPTWVSWGATVPQNFDSDFANDAFASLWASTYQAAPAGDTSTPVNNGTGIANYRNDLQTIASDGFNLVRLYNWDGARGTASGAAPAAAVGLDHLNFLNAANTLGLKIVVPVSDYYLNNDPNSWNNTPLTNYNFSSAPAAIQNDFNQFIASITDPTTGKIHAAIQSIDVGNEGDIGQGIGPGSENGVPYAGTTASQFLARTNWWIYNLNKQINAQTGTGPDGNPVVANPTTVMITATISNADAGNPGSKLGGWFNDIINGVTSSTPTPNGWPGGGTFGTAVTGLSVADPTWANYYYNSVNVAQSNLTTLASSISSQVLQPYDAGSTSQTVWPYGTFNVPLMLMEVFNNNRQLYSPTTDQATAAVNQALDIKQYLAAPPTGSTNLMGYNYFEFNDEPSQNKYMGLYQYPSTGDVPSNAGTGDTSFWYGSVPNGSATNFPVDPLTATPGPTGTATTLWQAWTNTFPATFTGTATNNTLTGTPAAESFQGLAGNDIINGGQGYDTALYGQIAQAYTLRITAGSPAITIQDKVGTDGTDTLTNIEQVRFANGALPTSWMLTTASMPAAQVLKVVDLYTAGLNRAPDALGLDYWASQLANGASIKDISKAIFSSPEAAAIYSPANSDPVFINFAYQTAFGHAPDAAGAAYWANELATGHIQRTDFVTALIAGASAADKQYVVNKEAVGAHFALTDGLNNITSAKAVEASVNGTAASVTAANAQSDAFAATAATAAGSELVVQIVGLVP